MADVLVNLAEDGRKTGHLVKRMSLLTLAPIIQQLFALGEICMGHEGLLPGCRQLLAFCCLAANPSKYLCMAANHIIRFGG